MIGEGGLMPSLFSIHATVIKKYVATYSLILPYTSLSSRT